MNSLALLYTPANEHFGIVPLEAQYYNTPVLASNSGGPKETVIHKQTGFLIDGAEEKWAEIMDIIANNEKERKEMGVKGKSNVIEKFSFHAFTEMLDSCVKKILGKSKKL